MFDTPEEYHSQPRTLCAIRFGLVTPPPRLRAVVVWPFDDDGPKRYLPAHPDKTWLDVKAGDVIVCEDGTTETVESVEVFRAYWAREGTPITCGRDWIERRC